MRLQHNANKIWGIIFALTIVMTISVPYKESIFAQNSQTLKTEMTDYMDQQLENSLSSYRFSNLKIKTDEDPNLYLTLLNEMGAQAHEKVINSLSEQGYNNIAIGHLSRGIAVQDDISEAYETELAFYTDLARHENEAMALEMFTNGSTRDGDFDLLDDLQKIENILFARRQDSQLGPAISRSSNNDSNSKSFSRPAVSPTVASTAATEDPETEEVASEEETATEPEESTPVIHENGDICQLDDDLAQELELFEETVATEEAPVSYEVEPEPGSFDGSEGDSSVDAGSSEVKGARVLGTFLKRDETCEKVFCFHTEEVRVTESAYFPDDNSCIACVLENIAETMAELNSESVYPRKVTGNFLEPSMCKGAFKNLKFDIKVSLVERPIFSSDPVDSITELSARSIVNDWRRQRSNGDRDQEAEEAIEAQSNLGSASDAVGLAVNSAQIQAQVDLDRRIQDGLFPVSSNLDAQAGLILELHQRMNSMTIFFDSYNQMLLSMQSTLNSLQSKPICE